MIFRKVFVGACFGLAAGLIAGCASEAPPPPPPTVANVAVAAAPGLNPNAAGRPSPVVLRVYYLVSPTSFEEADFFKLQEQDAAVLGADLVAKDEVLVAPGESKTLRRELREDARFVGVIASYREIDGAVWRASGPIQPHATNAVTVELAPLAVTLSAQATQ